MQLRDLPRLRNAGGLELAARRIVEGLYGGRHRSPFTGSATEFHDHRLYQEGDDLRLIDWRAYGRSDRLLIRRYREERDLPILLALDTSASMAYGEPDKGAWTALAAASLALLAIDQGDRVRLAHGAGTLAGWSPEVGGAAAMEQVCATLSALQSDGDGEVDTFLSEVGRRLERRTLVVLFSDLLLPAQRLAPALGALRARGHDLAVLQVLDRSELALDPEWGPSRLYDPEGREETITCDPVTLKERYDRAMGTHLSDCRRLVAGAGGDHILAATDGEVAGVLGDWLHRRAVR